MDDTLTLLQEAVPPEARFYGERMVKTRKPEARKQERSSQRRRDVKNEERKRRLSDEHLVAVSGGITNIRASSAGIGSGGVPGQVVANPR